MLPVAVRLFSGPNRCGSRHGGRGLVIAAAAPGDVMGYIANNVEMTRQALGNKQFQEWFEPVLTPFDDLPYLPPRHQSLLDRSNSIAQGMRASAKAAHDAGFVNRTQSGYFPWAGPPGHMENRPIRTPEQAGGDVLSWTA